ncbi:DUF559 domain-containing protein [Acidithiobacillus sp. MC6.1]|nr:DUF559 domain-containing protein [Acidithiobacillus sp. MC6.1]
MKAANGSVSPPQDLLWEACRRELGDYAPVAEYRGAVPGRKFRIDVAFPGHRLAVEIDGWQYHGQHLSAHRKDRERMRLLTLHGWRLLPFTAGEVLRDVAGCVDQIRIALRQCVYRGDG